ISRGYSFNVRHRLGRESFFREKRKAQPTRNGRNGLAQGIADQREGGGAREPDVEAPDREVIPGDQNKTLHELAIPRCQRQRNQRAPRVAEHQRAFDAEPRQRRGKEIGLALGTPDDAARPAAVAEPRTIETYDAKFACRLIHQTADGEILSIVPLPWNMTSGGASGSPLIIKCNRTLLTSRNSPIGG